MADIWYPKSKEDIDIITNSIILPDKLESIQQDVQEIQEACYVYPGSNDNNYKNRRIEIAKISSNCKHNDIIPTIAYTKCENNTWKICLTKLLSLSDMYACDEYRYGLSILFSNNIYNINEIPQLFVLNNFIKRETGWEIRPATGLISTRDFISAFAHKVFFSTQYIRHHLQPFYTPEPDIIHELIGHVPLLLNNKFSNFLQKLGNLSLGVSDDLIDKIGKLYWHTVEFGLCTSEFGTKIYGAGILSSVGEIEYCMDSKNINLIKQFDPYVFSLVNYPITTFQNIYSCVNNFDELEHLIENFIVLCKEE